MPAKTIFDRRNLLESLSIENWIVPMMFAGHFNEVAWIRPPWARQIADGTHKFAVGESDGRIHVSSPLDYFLSDGGYKDESLMENSKIVKVHVSEVDEPLDELINDSNWILDIDLDYFSTLNPFLSIYPKADTYEKLRKIFLIEKSYDANNPESLSNYVKERNRQLDFFESIFQHMSQHGSLEKFKNKDPSLKVKFELVQELVECLCHQYSIYDVDWFLVNDAGCTADDDEHQLPHHESTDEEIKLLMTKLDKFLKSLKKLPTVITIARSSLDGYTPSHQVESIQTQVLQVLRNVYAENLSTETLWYKNKSTDAISALDMVQPRRK